MRFSTFAMAMVLFWSPTLSGQTSSLESQLRELDSRTIVRGTVRQQPLAGMLVRDVEARLRLANRADGQAWLQVQTRSEWERFREVRIAALKSSLGRFPAAPATLPFQVTGHHAGDGYEVDNVVYATRPGVVVSANLYRPGKASAARAIAAKGNRQPAIIICHSHQSSKHTGWRQDMAMTWARAGCVVLMPDHVGHGERQQHPFGDESPHNYHFRFDVGIQLHLIGESLMGWLAWDLMRGVDLLLARDDVDPQRVIMISEPAGGGDVAAVTAALDQRITGVMVQNFGGPEPENAYPLPKGADDFFDFAGTGTWESTRNLRLSARDGFLPWSIVASAAPRRLIYDHEFYWDQEHDPVWKRLEKVWSFYDANVSLTGVGGHGFVVGSAPENSHWIPINRELLYPVLERWFQIPNPRKEFSQPRQATDLLCFAEGVRAEFRPQALHAVTQAITADRLAEARRQRGALATFEQRENLLRGWRKLLGKVVPDSAPFLRRSPNEPERMGTVRVERLHLSTEPGIVVPVLLLLPEAKSNEALPVVVAVSQQGKQAMLQERASTIAKLLRNGVAICLPDVRGTGETSPGDLRGRRGIETELAASEWMLGDSLLAGRLRDLRSVLTFVRQSREVDGQRVALWGDSVAKTNSAETKIEVPYTATDRPPQCEPLGGLLVLLTALFDEGVRGVFATGGLSDFLSVLESPFNYVPQDVILPGVLEFADLPDVAAAIAPRRLWLNQTVDARNRVVPPARLAEKYAVARHAFAEKDAASQLRLGDTLASDVAVADWLADLLKQPR